VGREAPGARAGRDTRCYPPGMLLKLYMVATTRVSAIAMSPRSPPAGRALGARGGPRAAYVTGVAGATQRPKVARRRPRSPIAASLHRYWTSKN
jgi:hypothetical protein